VKVGAHRLDAEGGGPAVVAQRLHRHAGPVGGGLWPVQDGDGDLVVALNEGVGLDVDGFADDTLDGEAARVDLRLDVLDLDARAITGERHGEALQSERRGTAHVIMYIVIPRRTSSKGGRGRLSRSSPTGWGTVGRPC